MQKRTILLSSLIAFAVVSLISCSGKSIKNGTYTSSVQGMNDAIEVSVTIA
ncbi:putative lipoprotein, partial [Treponema socranskii subsp. socranskii VPI DR56BR1116 = ATCC 35536]